MMQRGGCEHAVSDFNRDSRRLRLANQPPQVLGNDLVNRENSTGKPRT